MQAVQDRWIHNARDEAFEQAFRLYFAELGIAVKNWEGLFDEMAASRTDFTLLRTDEQGQIAGFIQVCPLPFTSWFFEGQGGFIREFWIAPAFRKQGHGSELLSLAEAKLREQECLFVLLTTDTAPGFYEKHGFEHLPGIRAKNDLPVWGKKL